MPLIGTAYGLSESDQLRIPTAAGYVDYELATLLDFGGGPLRATSNFGLPPVRFITQRGPFQDGETPLDLRLDPRVIQIDVAAYVCNRAHFWTVRNELLNLLRPNRAFSADGTYRPLIYRKRLPGGKPERGSDLVTTAGSTTVTSDYGRFVHYGGLAVGDYFELTSGADAGTYAVAEVVNDYTVVLDTAMGASATNIGWRYYRNNAIRDLKVLLEMGPTFDEQVGAYRFPEGYRETLRLVAHNPLWYGPEQSQSWAISDAIGDLVFDGAGAWFGATPGVGRWLFAPTFVGETVSVIYWGTYAARPTITLTGPATNPTISNTTLNLQLDLSYSVALGETVTIDTQALTVTNAAGDNLLSYLSGDLATFQLAPEPQAANRVNDVFVSFSDGVVGQSTATLSWNNQYIGV